MPEVQDHRDADSSAACERQRNPERRGQEPWFPNGRKQQHPQDVEAADKQPAQDGVACDPNPSFVTRAPTHVVSIGPRPVPVKPQKAEARRTRMTSIIKKTVQGSCGGSL